MLLTCLSNFRQESIVTPRLFTESMRETSAPGNVDGICAVYMVNLGGQTQKKHFRLVWIKCEAVPQTLIVCRLGILFDVTQVSYLITLVDCDIKLYVISILTREQNVIFLQTSFMTFANASLFTSDCCFQ